VRASWRAAAIIGVAVAAACGGADDLRRRSPAEPDLRIWTPLVVRWEAGRPRHVDFAIENPTNRTIAIAAPDPANARVEIYAGSDTFRVCGVAPSGPARPGARIEIGPGDRVAVRVDLDRACGGVPAGEYRFVLSYVAAPAASKDAFSGTLPAAHGQVIVSSPPAAVACVPDGATEARAAGGEPRHGRPARDERAARSKRPAARGPAPAGAER
jgi:hypothetical protein